MTNEGFPADPGRAVLHPADALQRVLEALQQDVAAGRHLLCVTGPPGSGKSTLLRALQQGCEQGLVGLIEKPTPGRLLVDVARALHIEVAGDDDSTLRRRLAMTLTMAGKLDRPIIQIVDDADSLSTDDIDLLVHFFPPGRATLILAGAADPEAWQADCLSSSGSAHFDRIHRLDPLSALETVSYPPSVSSEVMTDDVMVAPVRTYRRKKPSPAAPRRSRQKIDSDESAVANREHRLRRSVRRWRATAVLVSIALVAVLSKDAWIDRIPLDRARLEDYAAFIPVPLALDRATHEAGQATAPENPVILTDPAEPDTAAREPVLPEPLASEPEPAEPAVPESVAPAPVAQESLEHEPLEHELATPEPAAPHTATEPPPLTPAQRAEVARLYAVRAEYEWRNGDLESAAISIRNGLSTDPDNQTLLEMQAQLQERQAR